MQAKLGIDGKAFRERRIVPVVWDTRQMINPHILLMGTSGSGKTYTLRKIVRESLDSAEYPVRFHVFDVHNDLEIEGASSVIFSEQTDYGINPLVIDQDPHEGGVRKRIQALIGALNRTSSRLGGQQEATMRLLIQQLYEVKGFIQDDPETWAPGGLTPRGKPKTFPTLGELHLYAQSLKRQIDTLMTVNQDLSDQKFRAMARRYRKLAQKNQKGLLDDKEGDKLEELRTNMVYAYGQRLNQLATPDEGDQLEELLQFEDHLKQLPSLINRLGNLSATGVFKDSAPPFDPDCPAWRYNIKPLSEDEKKLFITFKLEEIIRRNFAQGETDYIREMVVLDEAHLFMDDDPLNPINKIAKEGRKFGLGLICASQSPRHFSEDFLSLVGAKIVLKIDDTFWQLLNSRMRIPITVLKAIVARETMIAQLKRTNESRERPGDFRLIIIPKDGAAAETEEKEVSNG